MEVKLYSDEYLDSLNKLLFSIFDVSKKCNSSNIEIICVNNNLVVGYLTVNECIDSLTGEVYGYVNYVCVLSEFRGLGVASLMFEYLFELCRSRGITYLELTSNPSRVAAHKLYEKLDFIKRDTDVFRRYLK